MYGKTYFVIDETGKVQDAQIKVSPTESVKKAVETLPAAG